MKVLILFTLAVFSMIPTNLLAQSNFRLHENGVTIVCDGAQVGDKGEVLGEVYTAVDRDSLRQLLLDGENVTNVCTSLVTSMGFMFDDIWNFNSDISSWDVSSVTNMSYMFFDFGSLSSDISRWDVSNVTIMNSMFQGTRYDGDLSSWDVSNVTDMGHMFHNSSFNGDISDWVVSNVNNMEWMFTNNENFNIDLSSWDVSNVTNMSVMFGGAVSFNQDISIWDVNNVTDMSFMFAAARTFNQNLSEWDVSSVKNMDSMFENAASFNQNLTGWCVENLEFEVPVAFSVGSSLESRFMPRWGTCPTSEEPAYTTPELIEPLNNTITASNTVYLVWSNVSGADLYDLQVSVDSTFNDTLLINVTELKK